MGADDPQCALHVDTFHSVVKLWVYNANMTIDHGPLYIVPGTHRFSRGKLKWLYGRTRDNPVDVMSEPSIRFDVAFTTGALAAKSLNAVGLPQAIPVLPLPGVARTLIVADTSALHNRGVAPSGSARRALRPMGAENDGGVKRLNPYRPL